MRNFLWTLLILGVFVLASLVSVDGAPAATCNARVYIAVTSSQEASWPASVAYSRTTCALARKTFQTTIRFLWHHGGAGDGDFYVQPRRNYTMHCSAHGIFDYQAAMHVSCTHGAAHVHYTVIS